MDENKSEDEQMEYDMLQEIFTKHPPTDVTSDNSLAEMRAYLKIKDLETEPNLLLPMKKHGFKKKENSVLAFHAFIIAHEAGLFPPMWVMNHMYEVFKNYIKAEGGKTLDEAFKLTRGSGQSTAIKALALEVRNQRICIDMHKLTKLFDLSIEEASNMLERLLEEMVDVDWSKHGNKTPPKALTISGIYRDWKRTIDCDMANKLISEFSREKRLNFIKGFPEDSLPLRIKNIL